MTDATDDGVTVDYEVDQYVQQVFARPDQVLNELLSEAESRGIPLIAIHPHEAKLVQVLLSSVRAKRVVEIGTCFGYGAIWLARALPEDGKLYTLEKNAEFQSLAKEYAQKAGLSERIDFRLGMASDLFPELSREGPFDAVFIDANWDEYEAYLRWTLENLRPGGLVLSHNAHYFGFIVLDPDATTFEDDFRALSEEAYDSYKSRSPEGQDEFVRALRAIRHFNQLLADDPRLTSTLISTTEGLAVAVYNP